MTTPDEALIAELPMNIEFAAAYLDGVMECEPAEIAKQWAIIRAYLSRPVPDREGINAILLPMEDFINGPRALPYPEPMEVGNYRHAAYHVWSGVRDQIIALASKGASNG